MGIRAKFLIILILFCVVPLLCFYLVNQRLFTRLGDDIFGIATVLVLQTTAKELQSTADNYTHNLNKELNDIARNVDNFRNDIEKLLNDFNLLPEEERHQIRDFLAQEMSLFYKKISFFRKDIVSITYFSTSGIAYTYPTKETSGFDREKIYEKLFVTKETPNDIFWELPSNNSSATSNLQYIAVSLPVHNNIESLLGYVIIGFDLIKLLEGTKPSSLWSEYEETILLNTGSFLPTYINSPLVLGIRNPRDKIVEWKAANNLFEILPSYKEEIIALFEGMRYGEAGYVSLPYRGEQSIWTYSDTNMGFGILNILPEREPLYKIVRHPGRLSKWLILDSFLIVSIVVVVMVVIVAYRSRRMLEPFFTIISAFKKVAGGDFSTKIEFKNTDERQMIANAFNTMTLQLEDGFRMRQGLEVAKEVQQHFFPEIDPAISDFDIAIRMSYCEETGGDHVDILKGDAGKVCIVVGDVTGHGIGAALHVATLRALIRSHYEMDSDLASVVTSVNSKLTADMGDSGRFVTLFLLELNPSTRELRWVRAGHDPGWLFTANGNNIISLDGPGIILGVDSDFAYSENHNNQLKSGNIILVGTDGMWESCDPEGNQFGKARMEQTISDMSHKAASDICDSLLTEVDQFRKGQIQEDDVSIVVIKVQ